MLAGAASSEQLRVQIFKKEDARATKLAPGDD
jgi:hypothetical protein